MRTHKQRRLDKITATMRLLEFLAILKMKTVMGDFDAIIQAAISSVNLD